MDSTVCSHHPPNCLDYIYIKDADSDIRLARRITRDTVERGRTVEEVIEQYHETVRPMHEAYVEPSKVVADLIVHLRVITWKLQSGQ